MKLVRLICALLALSLSVGHGQAEECERLQASLTYTQEEAPRDLSGVFPVVVERVNRVLDGVVDVAVEWTGANLHGRVGLHLVKCVVTRLAEKISEESKQEIFSDDEGRRVASQCFHLPFTILDTNECSLPMGHRMRHRCHDSSICVNTIGAYECLCPGIENDQHTPGTADDEFWESLRKQKRSPWELSFNSTSLTSCPSVASTHGCCPEGLLYRDGESCRASFRCPVDPCASNAGNLCAPSATCVRTETPVEYPSYTCQCPTGLMGNGRKCRPGVDLTPVPKVTFDGVTPTEQTIKSDFCDCTKPLVDACSGFPPCKGKHELCIVTTGNVPTCGCKAGFVMHETYGCVDETPPLLKLNHDPRRDQTLRLKQGDVYKEYAVDIQDENAEEYMRSLKISYSRPLPHGCLTEIEKFHVNYTVATPWTSPPFVRITRYVIVEDIDECSINVSDYTKSCPQLVPKCDFSAGATCLNTIGSYKCKCPKYTSGDGFLQDLDFGSRKAPVGFEGGTSCVDTSKPVINLVGPNPKVFRVCECKGISGVMDTSIQQPSELQVSQQRQYGDQIKKLVTSSSGAELCASHARRKPSSSECATAFDENYKGRVDLSKKVVIGEPVQKSSLRWAVPYNVKDEAGNEATTVWRDIVVEEVDLSSVESKIRTEVMKDQEAEKQRAIAKALEEDRRKRPQPSGNSRNRQSCPACPACNCSKPSGGHTDQEATTCTCPACPEVCTIYKDSPILHTILWLEDLVAPWLVKLVILSFLLTAVVFALKIIRTLVFSQSNVHSNVYATEERERAMQNAVQYHNGTNNMHGSAQLPPRASMSTTDSFFTPRSAINHGAAFASPPGSTGIPRQQAPLDPNDIYADPPLITPSRRGDGVRRRSPYQYQS